MRRALAAAAALALAAGWVQASSSTPAASLARTTSLAAGLAHNKASPAEFARTASFITAFAPPPSLPRQPEYPAGVCTVPCPIPPRPPCRDCTPGPACPAKTYPGSRASRNATYCVHDFRETCADPANAGCAACNLWREVSARCTPGEPSPAGCVDRGAYAWMPAREALDVNGTRLLCACATQALLVPTTPCTGVESEDKECTGTAAEPWWAWAFAEGAATFSYGAKVPPPTNSSAPPQRTWGVIVNAANRRSQHQTHLRVGRLNPDLPGAFGDLMPRWLGTRAFSCDAGAPTLTAPTPGSATPDPGGEVQAPLIATVFVPGGVSLAKPWATAAAVAAAAGGGVGPGARPYGVLVSPWAQAGCGLLPPDLGAVVDGVTVSAIMDVGSSQLLVEDPAPGDCVTGCYVWDGSDEGSGLVPLLGKH